MHFEMHLECTEHLSSLTYLKVLFVQISLFYMFASTRTVTFIRSFACTGRGRQLTVHFEIT